MILMVTMDPQNDCKMDTKMMPSNPFVDTKQNNRILYVSSIVTSLGLLFYARKAASTATTTGKHVTTISGAGCS